VGSGYYSAYAAQYAYDRLDRAFIDYHAHSLPLHLMVELGIPGIIMWFGLITGIAIWLVTYFRQSQVNIIKDPGFFLAWCILAILFHNLVDVTILYHPLKYIFPVLLANFIGHTKGSAH